MKRGLKNFKNPLPIVPCSLAIFSISKIALRYILFIFEGQPVIRIEFFTELSRKLDILGEKRWPALRQTNKHAVNCRLTSHVLFVLFAKSHIHICIRAANVPGHTPAHTHHTPHTHAEKP